MKPQYFQIVHYIPNLFAGARVPVAAVVRDASGRYSNLVLAEFHPDEHCLGGRAHVAMLRHVLSRLERNPQEASSAALGPHVAVDEARVLPADVEPAAWLRSKVLPRATHEEASKGSRRATRGYEWLKSAEVAVYVHKRFRPDKPGVPHVAELAYKNLKPVSHWVSNGRNVLLLEPVFPGEQKSSSIEDVSTVFGAYRFHLRSNPLVTLGVYMLPGGNSQVRSQTQQVLNETAHYVFDTDVPIERQNLLSRIRNTGAPLSQLLH